MILSKAMFAIAQASISRPDTSPLPLLFAVGLALVHIFAGKLRFLNDVPRSRWLSIAGGVSVAYVFVHILPDLSEHQESIERAGGLGIAYLEHHVYLVALLGLTVFYGLERVAESSRQRSRKEGKADATSAEVFWLHIASFAVYNALIGYLLLHRAEPGLWNLFFFCFALGLHFVVNDYGLREHHKGCLSPDWPLDTGGSGYGRVGDWTRHRNSRSCHRRSVCVSGRRHCAQRP